ncbi:cofilin-1-like [Halichoeres trimaculatus]|uniref:cofilin-1-like n=1 Tax=Halichoeres trimaculatus TaxID=147232 RepID=UPI003D9EAD6D
MASGIQVHTDVTTIYNEMKVVKNNDDSNQRLRLVTFTIQGDVINVDLKVTQEEVTKKGQDAYQIFKEQLKDEECFYFLYDCHYKDHEGIGKEVLIFGSWIPDTCAVKKKMLYASSKCSIKKIMHGIKHHMELSDRTDILDHKSFAGQVGKGLQDIEGTCVCTKMKA